jgi:TetR/AcrR family transcriptional regulator of autoinduction and epiphytic fitness
MTQPTSPKRAYNSTRRQAQARETRMQILTAARKLFIAYGYAGATIEAVAQEAGVAAETVFAIFGSKRTILARLMDVTVGGDDQPVPLLQRSGPQATLQESDPTCQLQLFAQDITTILERVAPLFEVLRMAAKTEPDIAELLKNLLQERFKNMMFFVQSLFSHGPMRQGLVQVQSAEIVWTLSSPEVFRLLTQDRGWSREQYIAWLGDTLVRLLLP